jgi:hypothetical protein
VLRKAIVDYKEGVKRLVEPLNGKLDDGELNLPSLIYKQHEILLDYSDLDLVQIFYKADASKDDYSDIDVKAQEVWNLIQITSEQEY